jgi:hypothetical protein
VIKPLVERRRVRRHRAGGETKERKEEKKKEAEEAHNPQNSDQNKVFYPSSFSDADIFSVPNIFIYEVRKVNYIFIYYMPLCVYSRFALASFYTPPSFPSALRL